MPKVFISHSWADNDISRKIAGNLKRDGAEIWIDFVEVDAGDSLPDRINKALAWCDTLVLLWSKSANDSSWVKLEWECCINLKKKIIPCILDNTRLQPILFNLKYIDFKNFEKGYNELCRVLKLQTPEEKKKAESEKLKLEQEPLEVERKKKEKQRKLKAEQERQEKEKQRKLKAEQEIQKKQEPPRFRRAPTTLSSEEVRAMLKSNDFFDSVRNEKGKRFNNQFRKKIINGGIVVIDQASELMWQQSGSLKFITYEKAEEYIQELNRNKFAGFADWRLPTLEEAMSLMEPKKMNGDLYIDPKFNAKQRWIWTADQIQGESRAPWVVRFLNGDCYWSFGNYGGTYVRAVRSRQSDNSD